MVRIGVWISAAPCEIEPSVPNLVSLLMEFAPLIEKPTNQPLWIAGPCSAETEQQVLDVALGLQQHFPPHFFRAGVWKPRTRPGAFEGVGERALPWLARVREEVGLRPIIEVATAHQVEVSLAAGIDAFWIGARTTVNPFSVQEVADALQGQDVVVLVKNPVNPDLSLWMGAIERIYGAGIKKLGAIHRGFSQYGETTYRNAPIWEIPIELRRKWPLLPIICDNSHICGNRTMLAKVAQSAMNLHFDGLMTETHCTPDLAWTDAKQQITPEVYSELMHKLSLRREQASDPVFEHQLLGLRDKIDHLDSTLLTLLADRMQLVREIGRGKQERDMAILQTRRYNEMLEKAKTLGAAQGLDEAFIERLLSIIHIESIEQQQREML